MQTLSAKKWVIKCKWQLSGLKNQWSVDLYKSRCKSKNGITVNAEKNTINQIESWIWKIATFLVMMLPKTWSSHLWHILLQEEKHSSKKPQDKAVSPPLPPLLHLLLLLFFLSSSVIKRLCVTATPRQLGNGNSHFPVPPNTRVFVTEKNPNHKRCCSLLLKRHEGVWDWNSTLCILCEMKSQKTTSAWTARKNGERQQR